MHKRTVLIPVIAVALTLTSSLSALGSQRPVAQGSTDTQVAPTGKDTLKWRSYTKRYEQRGGVAFPQLAVCVNYEVSGIYRYKKGKVRMPITNEVQYYIRGRLTEPTMRVWTTRYSDVAHVCTSRKLKWQTLTVTQNFVRPPCKRDFEFGISVPWGVSVAASPGCTKQPRASRSTTWRKDAWTKTQYNSEAKIPFEREMPFIKYVGQPQPTRRATCLDLFPRFAIEMPNGSDVRSGQRHRVCLGGRY